MDRSHIRSLLNRDRPWALYALCDLSPGYFEHCRWFTDGADIALLWEGASPPVLFAMGRAETLLPKIPLPQALYMQLQAEMVDALRRTHEIRELRPAIRMVLRGTPETPEIGARRLTGHDLPALEKLYSDGEQSDEDPDFFFPRMVDEGVFIGVFDDSGLIAAAGTHVSVPSESAAAIGNVYTRRDHRGQGLATALTAAVAAELRSMGIETIALNVYTANTAARGVYRRLGFEEHCEYFEGVAVARIIDR